MNVFRNICCGMASLMLAVSSMDVIAGQVTIANRFGNFQVEAKSLQEKGWDRVVKQEYDFSCGSAAVATLLTYHYQRDTTEAEVFESMIRAGDAEKIQRYGFSMLDMKRYLDGSGLNADGFRIALDDFIRIGVPAITMVNTGGYKHFVVVKGIDADNILVGDPAAGTLVVPREQFEQLWSGTVLGARAEIEVARQHFNHDQDWAVRPESPLSRGVNRSSVGASLLTLPAYNELGR
ncbi:MULTISPECIES: C39 family peptidase [unclassified Halomonas]|uniref:C39 family peptidase n=1 Tax=unclassified Halomonas TaxID=2609666 RepID=UPI002883C2A1|nr:MULTISPECIES: C39 family peptidase [unclassified Halomonas]MDT0501060.1 C39 family peptidase [Halomonas sp. PAR7]MDT0513251.1 C39 family peptidase [Halomonas sp. LES1]MDT0592237.1 C39 family peptidase [Halomonas sp. PAR8]